MENLIEITKQIIEQKLKDRLDVNLVYTYSEILKTLIIADSIQKKSKSND